MACSSCRLPTFGSYVTLVEEIRRIGWSACSWAWIQQIHITRPTPWYSTLAAQPTLATEFFIARRLRPLPGLFATKTHAFTATNRSLENLNDTPLMVSLIHM